MMVQTGMTSVRDAQAPDPGAPLTRGGDRSATRHPGTVAVGLLLLVVALVASACGGGTTDTAEPENPSRRAMSGDPLFDDLPRPPGADLAGVVSRKEGVITGSYFVRGDTPGAVLDWYQGQLPASEWEVLALPHQVGDHAWRGSWVHDGRRLQVVAESRRGQPQGQEGALPETQLSLLLYEAATVPAPTSPPG